MKPGMLITFADRPSDSPFIERVWRSHSDQARAKKQSRGANEHVVTAEQKPQRRDQHVQQPREKADIRRAGAITSRMVRLRERPRSAYALCLGFR